MIHVNMQTGMTYTVCIFYLFWESLDLFHTFVGNVSNSTTFCAFCDDTKAEICLELLLMMNDILHSTYQPVDT